MSNIRIIKIAHEIHKIITSVLIRESRDPRLKLISITHVDLSKDLSLAKVFFSSLNNDFNIEDIKKSLKLAEGFLKKNLAKKLKLRIIPKLSYIHDESLIYGNEMNKLINNAVEIDRNFIKNECY